MGSLQKACLIDAKGRVWDTHCPELRAQFGLADVAGDVTTTLVQTAGCIRIDANKRAVHIAFNPKTVSPVAIGGMMYFLHDQHLHRLPEIFYCLSILEDQASSSRVVEVYATIKQAANRLQFLSEEHRLSHQNRFKSRPLPLAAAKQDRGLSQLLDAWHTTHARYDANILVPISTNAKPQRRLACSIKQ